MELFFWVFSNSSPSLVLYTNTSPTDFSQENTCSQAVLYLPALLLCSFTSLGKPSVVYCIHSFLCQWAVTQFPGFCPQMVHVAYRDASIYRCFSFYGTDSKVGTVSLKGVRALNFTGVALLKVPFLRLCYTISPVM